MWRGRSPIMPSISDILYTLAVKVRLSMPLSPVHLHNLNKVWNRGTIIEYVRYYLRLRLLSRQR